MSGVGWCGRELETKDNRGALLTRQPSPGEDVVQEVLMSGDVSSLRRSGRTERCSPLEGQYIFYSKPRTWTFDPTCGEEVWENQEKETGLVIGFGPNIRSDTSFSLSSLTLLFSHTGRGETPAK